MKKVVRVVNKSGLVHDTEIIVDGKKLPLSHLMNVDVRIRPDEFVTAVIELRVDELETLASVDIIK